MRRVFSSICPKYYSYYHSHTRVTFFIIATCFLVVQLAGRLGSGNPFCLDKLEVMNYFFFSFPFACPLFCSLVQGVFIITITMFSRLLFMPCKLYLVTRLVILDSRLASA